MPPDGHLDFQAPQKVDVPNPPSPIRHQSASPIRPIHLSIGVPNWGRPIGLLMGVPNWGPELGGGTLG
jgi:hypothetical protein